MLSPAAAKSALRAEGLARRDALSADYRAQASARIAEFVLDLPELSERPPTAGYWPIRSEVDCTAALEVLALRGAALALPVVAEPHLRFRRWRPGEPLARRTFGLMEPTDEAPELVPGILLMPLVRFDRRGGRIGYGKGHYDRTIAALSVHRSIRTIGLAFAVQEAEMVPVEAHDRPLDVVITEAEIIRVT